MSEKAPFMVFSGTNSRYLAEKICASLDCPLGKMNTTHFADGEFAVSYEESIRGSHVFLVQSTFPTSGKAVFKILSGELSLEKFSCSAFYDRDVSLSGRLLEKASPTAVRLSVKLQENDELCFTVC